MGYAVEFAGTRLDKYCKVLNVQRDILPPRTNYSKSIPTMHGSFFTGFHYGERTITIEIALVAKNRKELMEKVRKLADVLDVKNPSRLEISDEPDKYYYAVVDGETSFEKLFQTGTCTITFICHDPCAYSTTHKVFTPDSKKKITIDNKGSAETSPVIEVDFRNKACFFQVTNPKKETVLIGVPKKETQPTQSISDKILSDDCGSASKFGSLASSLIDGDKQVTGQYGVGINGSAIICTNYGSSAEDVWTGTAFKRNIGQNVDEFEVKIDLTFSSQGKNYIEPEQPTVPPPPATPSNPNPPTTNTYGTYKVVNCGGLWINQEPNTSKPLYAMSPNTKIYPTEISNGWAKHTHSNQWNTFTGWSSMKYLQKISDSIVKSASTRDEEQYAESQLGILEIYGFDQNGAKLFKISFSDNSKYYEYVEPQFYIGENLILDDGKTVPTARKVDVKDDGGKVTGQREVESGVFGDFNDFDGNVTIRREKNSSGKYFWSASINKIVNGSLVKCMATSNSLSNDAYPKGQLNYLGFYIGRYGTNSTMSVAGIKNIEVKRLNMKIDEVATGNTSIFDEGDHLQIDFNNGLVTLNQRPFLTNIDIGSEFFTIPTGTSQIITASDDEDAVVLCGIQEKFI